VVAPVEPQAEPPVAPVLRVALVLRAAALEPQVVPVAADAVDAVDAVVQAVRAASSRPGKAARAERPNEAARRTRA
jgi:hypothetical protein